MPQFTWGTCLVPNKFGRPGANYGKLNASMPVYFFNCGLDKSMLKWQTTLKKEKPIMRNTINSLYWLTLVFLLISVGNLSSFAQDEHTVLLYTFETGAGKVVKDLSEHKNDGELMGPKWGEGNPGGGLVFD